MKLNQALSKQVTVIILVMMIISACVPSDQEENLFETTELSEISSIILTDTFTSTNTAITTNTPTISPSPTITLTATKTSSPTITSTATQSPTPTYQFPQVEVNVEAAHCRYGASKAYLHAADLYKGDKGEVHGRFLYSNWLYIKWDKLDYRCWVSPYVVDVYGDISIINYTDHNIHRIPTTLYPPPQNVRATRKGDMVTIFWDRVPMTEDDDRGYLIDAWVCQEGAFIWWAVSFEDQFTTSYSVKDQEGCVGTSSGVIYTVEKHGYTDPTTIPWPSH